MPTDPINQIAETLAESLYHATTHVVGHTGIALAANSLANASSNNEAQGNHFYHRIASSLSPFPLVKKGLTFFGLEGLAHIAKKPISRCSQKLTPAAKKFFTPIIKKAIEPVFNHLQGEGLLVLQDPVEVAERAKKIQESTLAATQATQAATQAMKTAAAAAAKTVEEVKNVSAQVKASWIPEWLKVDFSYFSGEENTAAPSTAELAAQQMQAALNQAVKLAQAAVKQAQATIELTQKAAEDLSHETVSAFSAKAAQGMNAAKNAGTYLHEVMQGEHVPETLNNSFDRASKLLHELEEKAPQAGKTVAELFERGVRSYNYSTSVAGSLVENVGEALGVSNPVALGIIATAGILSYWGLKSGYNYMLTSTTVSNVNTNHNVANSQPVVNVYNVTPVPEATMPKSALPKLSS